jgi:hypothetical protein
MNTNNNMNKHDEEPIKPKTRKEYMRQYMKTYNLKKGRKPREETRLTAEQRRNNLKESQKKYYLKNKDFIKKKRTLYLHNKKIEKLKNKINFLESINIIVEEKQNE